MRVDPSRVDARLDEASAAPAPLLSLPVRAAFRDFVRHLGPRQCRHVGAAEVQEIAQPSPTATAGSCQPKRNLPLSSKRRLRVELFPLRPTCWQSSGFLRSAPLESNRTLPCRHSRHH